LVIRVEIVVKLYRQGRQGREGMISRSTRTPGAREETAQRGKATLRWRFYAAWLYPRMHSYNVSNPL
jgi:hypothetical protein